MILRPYQRQASDSIFAEWQTADSTLAVLPTGLGKTVVFSDVIRRAFPRRAMVIAHREELIWQAKDKISRVTGLNVGVEMADYKTGNSLFGRPSVVVSTVQTQTAGGDGGGRMGKFDPSDFGLLIIDEAHHATSQTYRRMIDYYRTNPRLKVLGVTATPDRADEAALGQVFDTVAMDYEILDAIHDGWLVPILQQMVSVHDLDFSQVRTTAGDLNGADLARIMEAEKTCQEVAGASIDIVGDKRTLVFTSSVKHAEMTCNIFNRHRPGMAEWVCGKTDKEDRRKILKNFETGQTQVVVNCAVLTEGFDNPSVEVIVMGRPTKSRSLYAQMCGRATRPLPGVVDGPETPEERREAIAASSKPSCLVVDFTGNAGKHKLMTTADILGGKVSDEVIERAVTRAKKSGKPVSMTEAMEEEEELVRQEKLQEEARKVRLVARAKFTAQSVNPFDVFAISPAKPRGWDEGKTLTEKQRALLVRQNIDPDKLTYAEGRQLVTEIFRRWDKKLCTYRQARLLKKYGYSAEMTMEEAKKTIDALAANNWRRAA